MFILPFKVKKISLDPESRFTTFPHSGVVNFRIYLDGLSAQDKEN